MFSNNADMSTNGGLQVDYEYSGMFLSNGLMRLVLFDNGLTEVDRVEWDNGFYLSRSDRRINGLDRSSSDNNVGCELV